MIKQIEITANDLINYRNRDPAKAAIARDMKVPYEWVTVSSAIQIKIKREFYNIKGLTEWLKRYDYNLIHNMNIPKVMEPIKFCIKLHKGYDV